MLTKNEFNELIGAISGGTDFTPEIEESVKRLQDDFDKREAIPAKSDQNEEPLAEHPLKNTDKKINWQERYMELDKRYRERFFTTPGEVKKEQEENVKSDGEPKSYEQLFKERE